MASLTPLAKRLIGLAVIGAMASAVWHLALKDRFVTQTQSQAPGAISTSDAPLTAPTAQAPGPASAQPEVIQSKAPTVDTSSGSGLSAAENTERGRKLLDGGNVAQARVHLEQAVKDGDGAAACYLGEMTLKGQGAPADQEKAASLFQLAQSRNSICFASGK